MKWFLLTVGVFVGVVALCAAAPWPAMLGVADAVGHSVEAVVNGIEQLAGRRAVHVDGARDRPGNPRNEIFAADLFGRVRVIDGDTIDVGGSRVRLHGVDARESAQSCLAGDERWPCGSRATRALAQRIDGRTVACEQRDLDRYGRIVAECRQDGRDLNAWLVAEGWALAYRRYSRAYVDEESAAKAARKGVWRGEFVAPWDWRRGERLRGVPREAHRVSEERSGRCDIKGNISHDRGRRIYHMPDDRDYVRTRISPSRGERWFWSEAEARAEGWRRAGR